MKLGDEYICTHKLVRTCSGKKKFWEAVKITPTKVIVTGKRNLSNGTVWNEDGVTQYDRSESFQAIKVAPNLATDFLCLPEHLKPIEP